MPTPVQVGQTRHFEIYVDDVNDDPVTGLVQANFGIKCIADGALSSDTVTLTEIDATNRKGWYDVAYTPALSSGTDVVFHVTHATYNIRGWKIEITVTNAGAYVVTLSYEDEDTAAPIVGVSVDIYNADSTVKLNTGVTDSDGEVSFNLDSGTYRIYSYKLGSYTFTNPTALTVSGTTTQTVQGSAFAPSTPVSDDLCIVYGWEVNPAQTGLSVPVEASIVATNYFLKTNPHVVRGPLETTSDEDYGGYWELALTRTADFAGATEVQYKFKINNKDMGTYSIPDQASVAFKDLVVT